MYKALQESVVTSDKLASLTDFQFRVWAYGLVKADVVGRFTANPRLFRAIAMPLSSASDGRVQEALKALADARLIHVYIDAERPVLVYHDHEQAGTSNLRHQKSQYPAPPSGMCKSSLCCRILPGEPTAVGTAVTSAVTTAVDCSRSRSRSSEGVQGEGDGAAARAVTYRLVALWNDGRPVDRHIRVTRGREAHVAARLKEFTEEQLRTAVKNLMASGWHNGVNDRGWRAPGPEFVLRSVEKVEQFLTQGLKAVPPVAQKKTCRECGGQGEVPAQSRVENDITIVVTKRACPGCQGRKVV